MWNYFFTYSVTLVDDKPIVDGPVKSAATTLEKGKHLETIVVAVKLKRTFSNALTIFQTDMAVYSNIFAPRHADMKAQRESSSPLRFMHNLFHRR